MEESEAPEREGWLEIEDRTTRHRWFTAPTAG